MLLSGAGAPAASLGSNGDFYIDDVAWEIYGPKEGGTWPAGVSMIGPAGAAGPAGATGPAGPQGPAGTVAIDNSTIQMNTAGQLYVPQKIRSFRGLQMYCTGTDDGTSLGFVGFKNVVAGNTVGCIQQIPPGVAWLRFRFSNVGASGNMNITNAAYSPTSKPGNGFSSYDATGAANNTLFLPVTFNNGGADVPLIQQIFAAAPPANVYTASIAPNQAVTNSSEYLYAYYFSDWMPFSALARSDGGQGLLVNVRASVSDAGQYFDYAGIPNSAADYTVTGYTGAGNAAVSPYALPSANAATINPVHGMDYVTSDKVFATLAAGDSIFAGSTATANVSAFSLYAAGFMNAAGTYPKFVTVANGGFGGQQSLFFYHNAYLQLQHSPFDVIIIQSWSENDNNTTNAQALAVFMNAIALAEYCMEQDIRVILSTAAPVYSGSTNTAQEAIRQYSNGLVRGAGYPVLDLDKILGTGSEPINQYEPGYSTTPPHPNDTGHQAIATGNANSPGLIALYAGMIGN